MEDVNWYRFCIVCTSTRTANYIFIITINITSVGTRVWVDVPFYSQIITLTLTILAYGKSYWVDLPSSSPDSMHCAWSVMLLNSQYPEYLREIGHSLLKDADKARCAPGIGSRYGLSQRDMPDLWIKTVLENPLAFLFSVGVKVCNTFLHFALKRRKTKWRSSDFSLSDFISLMINMCNYLYRRQMLQKFRHLYLIMQ